MIRYVYENSKAWYLENTPNGDNTWSRLGDKIKLVIGRLSPGLRNQRVFYTHA